ncbi:DNA-binding protein RFX5 [Lucilia cuprina]|nr:DNA-binding protein RFX5 [Lucilia cuprina]
MSENKNGQGAQWSKGAVTAAVVAAQKQQQQQLQQQQHLQHTPVFNATALSLTSPPAGTASALYGGTGHLGTHQTSSDVTSYAAARFQAPPIDHRSASTSSSHIVPPTPTPSSTTNVPVPSGFIPPPFPPAAAAATSVLTPNPYAVASLTAPGSTHASANHPHSHAHSHPPPNQQYSGSHPMASSHHAHFGMEQFQHLNVQQQYELSKLMAASFSATQQAVGVSSGPTNLSSNTTSFSSSSSTATASSTTTNVSVAGTSTSQTSATNRHPPQSSGESSTSGSINTQMADQVISAISTGTTATKLATTPIHGRLMGLGVHAPDEEKLRRIQQVVESGIGDHAKQQIVQILDRISTLRPVEKLLLYLRLPGEQPETDPLRQPQNPLGTRSEINHTINWVRTHLEQDPQVSIPKQDVYNDYLVYCERLDIKPLSTADFGKVMKQVFPGIRPRRLGTRGHSRYCYAAMRKTSKLPAPHLPTLTTVKPTKSAEKDGSIDLSTNIIDNTEEQEESWSVVKQWAESMLHVKIDNISDLATHIKTNGPLPLAGGTHTPYTGAGRGTSSSVAHKKHTQREPKEKRVMADMGPLKKRRKKKRKGSFSSESSCHQNVNTGDQQQIQAQLSPANSSKSGSHHAVLSPAMEDGQKVKIKQEVIDSPGYPPSVGSLSTHSQSTDSTNVTQYQTTSATNTLQMAQHQVMPMNLAAETRGGISNVLARAPPMTASLTASAFEHVRPTGVQTPTTTVAAAVKNLTPKIMELSTENQAMSSPPSQTVIKQEIGTEDYNTSNIFCKKVRKAQQTKGFWANSPTSNRSTTAATTPNYPIITTTASTPPPVPASVITAPPNNSDSVVVYNMGPPTQMAPSTSPNSQTLGDDVSTLGQPKVLSRNLQQLKAKKILAAVAAAGCDPPDLNAAKDAADLPANLGLPRERVISICNMDKHELDDYFLPVEEENSEDQETELLQYFQMGDAEEKLTKNSSSDAKRNSNSTVNQLTSASTSIPKSTIATTASSTIGSLVLTSNSTMTTSKTSTGIMMMSTYKSSNNTPSINDISTITNSQLQNGKTFSNTNSNTTANSTLIKLPLTSSCLTATTSSSSSSCSNTVGTASASLAQLNQKHQQQMQIQQQQHQQLQQQSINQHQQQQQQNQPQVYSKVSIKRKINLNTTTTTSDITAARKNYSFLPISPNINTTTTSCSNNTSLPLNSNNTNNSHTSNAGFFASPGLSRLLTKQQSLDCDTSSDPMIGATRRQRSYNTMMTSASAPPSPSVLKQQQEQQLFGHMSHNILMDQWSNSVEHFNNPTASSNVVNSLMVDQNSLDLDLFGEAAAAAASTATNTTFGNRTNFNMNINNNSEGIMGHNSENSGGQINDVTQRSQSVPLSQLQRTHSPTFNRTFHCGTNNPAAVSACNSLAQTPVPSEFMDSVTMLSENSCSQQSATIKLEEVANVVASDSTAMLDEVVVSDILSSPDFVSKFSSLNQTGTTKTTCSSAGSSSGYSSAGHFSLSSGSYSVGGGGNGSGSGAMTSSISRSVPSTPLPHQNPQNLFGNGNNFYRRRFVNNCQSLNGVGAGGVLDNLNSFSHNFSSSSKYGYGNMSSSLSRSACDISKSMPSTPITTTPSSFRYSPSEFARDFLINGNTIDDSITSSFGAVGSDNLMGSDVVGVDAPLNSESLLNEEDTLINGSTGMGQVDTGVLTPDFSVQSGTSAPDMGGVVGESSVVIGVGSDLLDNL